MTGSMITFGDNGRTHAGYLALPASGRGPGVIVIQEWWGLVDHIKSVVDRVAAAGFVALAPDMYDGVRTTSPDEAGKLLMALNIAGVGTELRGAADYLRALAAVEPRRVAALGFCMGGQLALFAAQEHPDVIDAAVDFYGVHPNVAIEPKRIRVPVLGHFAIHDKSVPVAKMRELARAVGDAGGAFELCEYDAGHAFFNDARPQVFDQANADLAWNRTLTFLRARLA